MHFDDEQAFTLVADEELPVTEQKTCVHRRSSSAGDNVRQGKPAMLGSPLLPESSVAPRPWAKLAVLPERHG